MPEHIKLDTRDVTKADKLANIKMEKGNEWTPSQLSSPAYMMCFPFSMRTDVANNIFMKQNREPLDKDRAYAQWMKLYNYIASQAFVQNLPAKHNFQDIIYVANIGMYFPHDDKQIMLLSNYTSQPRIGEEMVAKTLFDEMDYKTIKCPYCYDEETEILTDSGWKLFKDLNQKDKVMTMNPDTSELEYQKPIAYQKIPYSDKEYMYEIKNRSVHLTCTDDHSVYYKPKDAKSFKFGKPKDIPKEFKFKMTGIWKGRNIKYFELPKVDNIWDKRNYKFDMKLWMRFLGWYLSEGCCPKTKRKGDYPIIICQSRSVNPKNCEEIINIIKEMGFNYCQMKDTIVFNSKAIYQYLIKLGLSKEKYIPQNFKNLSPVLLKELISTMMKGDGHSRDRAYFTSSDKLANDFQEICIKCGWTAFIKHRQEIKRGKLFKGNIVYFRYKDWAYFKKYELTKVPNTNKYVYDVTVPKYHLLLVRKNGCAFISGNCWEGEAELKYLGGKNYVGGYGMRTDKKAFDWMEEKFDMNIVKVHMTSEEQYHLDCSIFPVTLDKTMVFVKNFNRDEIKAIEKYTEIIEVPEDIYDGDPTNCVRMYNIILATNQLSGMKRTDRLYMIELKKIQFLEKVCAENGMELVTFNMSEFEKAGAGLSCCIMNLNYRSYFIPLS